MSEVAALMDILNTIRAIRERWTAEVTTDARDRATVGLMPIASRGSVSATLETGLGSFGVPVGWDVLKPAALQSWRDRSLNPVVGAMVRSDPAPTSIIDVTPRGEWPEDPRDFPRIATDLRQIFIEYSARHNLPVQNGPGSLIVDGYPSVWFYQAGVADRTQLMHAHVWALVRNHVIALELMSTATNFARVVDDFWTTVATAHWR